MGDEVSPLIPACFLRKQLAWCNWFDRNCLPFCPCWPFPNERGSTLPWKAGPAGSSLGWLKDTGSFVPTKLFCFHFRGEVAYFWFGSFLKLIFILSQWFINHRELIMRECMVPCQNYWVWIVLQTWCLYLYLNTCLHFPV